MSSIDRVSNQLPSWVKREESPGVRYDSGPYIGIVKDNRDPTYSGRLQVWISDFGGDANDPKYWRTVGYASPFLGSTVQENYGPEQNLPGSDKNSFNTVRHTYGMWYNLPDLENWVLCVFVAGDPSRGYWFACIPNQAGHHMVPAIGSSEKIDTENIADSALKSAISSGEPLPVVEFNEYNGSINWSDIRENRKPLHEPQTKILLEQGLDRYSLTKSRGVIKSNSQRETPSGVFGFSTPGRSAQGPVPATATNQQRAVKARLGGHSFVMDDGDEKGQNNLTRWRSAGGHTILMDDQERILYIINSSGSTYIEMHNSGHLNVYSSNSINFRTKAEFNIHADSNMNVNVGGNFNLNVAGVLNMQGAAISAHGTKDLLLYGGSLRLGSEGRLDLHTTGGGSFTASQAIMISGKTIGLNSGSGPKVNKPRDLPIKSSDDTKRGANGAWEITPNSLRSVATMVPTHEPWTRKSGVASKASNSVETRGAESVSQESQVSPDSTVGSAVDETSGRTPIQAGEGGLVVDSQGNPVLSGTRDAGIDEAAKTNIKVKDLATESDMLRADAPNGVSIGNLDELQVKALKTQIAKNESNFKYNIENEFGYIGRYQFGAAALVDRGYISRAAYDQYGGGRGGNNSLDDPAAWTGKDGIKSKEEFLSSPSVQEKVMDEQLRANYKTGLKIGAIKATDNDITTAGILQTSHLLGPGGAKKWRFNGGGQDAYGTTGTKYFNLGAYAVNKLGKGP